MDLNQLLPLADSPEFIHSVKDAIVKYHDEIRDMDRKPRFFTVCIDSKGEICVINRFLQQDTETLTRIIAAKRLPDRMFICDLLCSSSVEKCIVDFILYNSVMLGIEEPESRLPLLINSESFAISTLVKSRLNMPWLWSKLRLLCLYHSKNPVCTAGYAGKAVEMYLAPISLLNFILGLDSYRKSYSYISSMDCLTAHIGGGFYTTFKS